MLDQESSSIALALKSSMRRDSLYVVRLALRENTRIAGLGHRGMGKTLWESQENEIYSRLSTTVWIALCELRDSGFAYRIRELEKFCSNVKLGSRLFPIVQNAY